MFVADFDYELPPGTDRPGAPGSPGTAAGCSCWAATPGSILHGSIRALPESPPAGRSPGGQRHEGLSRRGCSAGASRQAVRSSACSSRGSTGTAGRRSCIPARSCKPGARVRFERSGRVARGEILERRFYGRRVVRLWTEDGDDVDRGIDAIGHVPLPPYIKRADRPEDRDRYQTVFARARGSVAAPTAGLHLSGSPAGRPHGEGGRADCSDAARRATAPSSRSASIGSRSTRSMPSASRLARPQRRPSRDARRRGAAGHRRRHDDDPGARGAAAPLPDGCEADAVRHRAVHLSGPSLPRRGRPAHQLPPSAVVAADARVGVCRPRARAGGLPRGRRAPATASTATATRC